MDIQISAIIFQIINFGIVFFVLNKFLYKPVVTILKQRSIRIADGLKAADLNLKAQEELEEKEKKVLADARAKADKIMKQVKKDAQVEAQTLLTAAKEDAKKLLDKERKTMQANFEAEKTQLEKSVSKLVTQTTEALLSQYLSASDQKKIVEQQVKELKHISLT